MSAGTLIANKSKNRLKYVVILAVSVLIKIGIRYGDKKYIQAKAIVLAIHKSNTILVALPIFFILVKYG